jgi:hypothetical protein
MTTRTRKPSFSSTEECFEAARELMTQLEHKAQGEAAAYRLDPEDRRVLEELREAAHAAVRRR